MEAQKKHSPVEEPSLDHLCLRGDPSSVLVKTLLLEGFLTLLWGLVLPNSVSLSDFSRGRRLARRLRKAVTGSGQTRANGEKGWKSQRREREKGFEESIIKLK